MTTENSNSAIPKITRDDEEAGSGDLARENIERLKALFPQIVADGQVDFDVLRQLLGDEVEEGEERYGLNWKGKRRARAFAMTPSLGTLRPAPEDSVGWDTTQNIMIEGENLEVLKLLRRSYAAKVKLIYIDPPYNTGKDFVYPDNYKESLSQYKRITGQSNEEGVKLTTNSQDGGRFHGNWVNMIYPRLVLSKEFLSQDGAIFVSCDETEHANLREVMDEIFGSENFVGDMVWSAGRKNDSTLISISHEYIVVYARSLTTLKSKNIVWRSRKKGLDEIYQFYQRKKKEHGENFGAIEADLKKWYSDLPPSNPAKAHKHYRNVDRRGIFFAADISWPGGGGPKYEVLHPTTQKPVKIPSRGWITPDQDKMATWIADERVHFGPNENKVPTLKAYLEDQEYQAPYSVFYQDGRAATKRLRNLMGADVFDFPKDENVISEIVEMATDDGDLILDFFAGSGTTAHAVWDQSAKDGKHRRFAIVQLPEPIDPTKKAQEEAGQYLRQLEKPMNIAELTKERLRRAGKNVREEHPDASIDSGFRVYKLATSSLKPWQPDPENLEASILDAVDNVLPDRSEDDLLVELLLKTGIDLTMPEEKREIAGQTVHALGGGALMVCLGNIADEQAEELGQGMADWVDELDPAQTTVYFKDSGIGSDGNRAATKANLAAILRQRLGDRIAKIASI